MGSKARIAKYFVPILQECIDENYIDYYIEPFVGGANIIDKIKCKNRIGYDNNPYLIALLAQIQRGWNPLQDIDMSKNFYNEVRTHQQKYALEVVGLTGFCATYNAKWFGGYTGEVTTKIGTIRNYYNESVRNLLKQAKFISDIYFNCKDYSEIVIPNNSVIYCDPPYENTTSYKTSSFDYSKYWQWVKDISKYSLVICNEYKAPSDFVCIKSCDLTTTLNKNKHFKATEKLFTYKDGLYYKRYKNKLEDTYLRGSLISE